jgi:hypothetical protein
MTWGDVAHLGIKLGRLLGTAKNAAAKFCKPQVPDEQPNEPLERAGMSTSRRAEHASAGRSAASR